jgi:hypothetical protein
LFARGKPSDMAASRATSLIEQEAEHSASLAREGGWDNTAVTESFVSSSPVGIDGGTRIGRARPIIPRQGLGPVHCPNNNDVLCDWNEHAGAHAGNIQLRKLAQCCKDYFRSGKQPGAEEKAHIAYAIVLQIEEMNPRGRFLKLDPEGCWYDIGTFCSGLLHACSVGKAAN